MVLLKDTSIDTLEGRETFEDISFGISLQQLKQSYAFNHYSMTEDVTSVNRLADFDLESFATALNEWVEQKIDGDDQITFQAAANERQLRLAKIEPQVLREWYNKEELHFREDHISPKKLSQITVPLEPDQTADGPVMIVILPSGERVIPNGNHRTFKALCSDNSPLYAVEFSSPDAFFFTFGCELKPRLDPDSGLMSWGSTRPKLID